MKELYGLKWLLRIGLALGLIATLAGGFIISRRIDTKRRNGQLLFELALLSISSDDPALLMTEISKSFPKGIQDPCVIEFVSILIRAREDEVFDATELEAVKTQWEACYED